VPDRGKLRVISLQALTDDESGVKGLYFDFGLMPDCVILDPELTTYSPESLWRGTGIKALDTAIDCLLQFRGPQLFWDPILLSAARDIVRGLQAEGGSTATVDDRGALQVAAWRGIYPRFHLPMDTSMPRSARWLGAAVRHQIGGIYRCSHGELAGILLPGSLRFHRDETRGRQQALATALGIATLDELEASITALVTALGLPTRLSELGVGSEHLDAIVSAVMAEEPSLSNRRDDIVSMIEQVV
jgi:alcohol dehydrogenase class IV